MTFLELLINKRFLLYLCVLMMSTVMSIIFFTALYAGRGVGSHDVLFLIEEYGYILLGLTITALACVIFEVITTPKLQDPEYYRSSIQQPEIERLNHLLNEFDLIESSRITDRSKRFKMYGITTPTDTEQCHSLLRAPPST